MSGRRRALVAVAQAALVLAGAAIVPRAWCGRDAGALFEGRVETQEPLARAVVAGAVGSEAAAFRTGSGLIDGEWALVTQQMTALGLGQIALAHPELREDLLPAVEASVERLLAPESTAFGTRAWDERGLDTLGSEHGHAYLGYLDMALGMLRLLRPDNRFAGVHDRLTEALARRLAASPYGMIETYPGTTFPADVGSVVGSIGLYDRATGADHRALLDRWATTFRARYVDPGSGLVFQTADPDSGKPTGPPRGSGTAILVYFLSFADPSLSHDLFGGLQRSSRAGFLGFGGIREYAPGQGGRGDIDSGPVLLGVSVAATGFTLAGARLWGDGALFTDLYRTTELFGVSVGHGEGRRFMSGGPLGNALLLAMVTAIPGGRPLSRARRTLIFVGALLALDVGGGLALDRLGLVETLLSGGSTRALVALPLALVFYAARLLLLFVAPGLIVGALVFSRR